MTFEIPGYVSNTAENIKLYTIRIINISVDITLQTTSEGF